MSDKDLNGEIQADELDKAEAGSKESWDKADNAVGELEKLGHEEDENDEK